MNNIIKFCQQNTKQKTIKGPLIRINHIITSPALKKCNLFIQGNPAHIELWLATTNHNLIIRSTQGLKTPL